MSLILNQAAWMLVTGLSIGLGFCVSHDVGLRLSSVSNHEVMPSKVSEEVALADPSASFVLPIKGFAVSARDFKTAVVPIMTPLDEALPCRQLLIAVDHVAREDHYFTSDPLFTNLRDEPQFSELMTIARSRHTAFRKRFF